MPKQSYLTKERKKLQRKAGKAIRKRYETARDNAQERTVKAIAGTGQKAWSVATKPVQRRTVAKEQRQPLTNRLMQSPLGSVSRAAWAVDRAVGNVIKVKSYTKANGTRVKGHDRATTGNGSKLRKWGRATSTFGAIIALYLLAPTTAQAQGIDDICLLMNGDVQIVVASPMQPAEYNTLKYEMGKGDLSDANFLGHLRRTYCPTELQGLDEIVLSEDAPTSDYRSVSAEQHDNRQAYEEAHREYQLWLSSQPQPRTITQRINDGLTEPYHYSQLPFVPSEDFRTTTGQTVVSQWLPEPTQTPTESGNSWLRWFTSFCITALVVVGLMAAAIFGGMRLLRQGEEANDSRLNSKLAGGKA